jgi:pimeloyl-ACP methyl ester carboxylesterase
LLAADLGFKTYHAIGGSGGGPFALVCAHQIPKTELKGTGVLAGIAPPEAPNTGQSWERWFGIGINRWLPAWLIRSFVEAGLGSAARNPDQTKWRKIIIEGMIKKMDPEDQTLFGEKETEAMITEMRDAGMSGSYGIVHEAKMILGKWPFDLKDIDAKVRLWNGTKDTDVPVSMGKWQASQLRNGSLKEFPGLTHFSLPYHKSEEILQDLINL